jgi:hypothetical protein
MTIKRQGASAFNITGQCPSCREDIKVRHREFSAQAWTFLAANNEVDEDHVGEAICDDCYSDMREFLIESISDVELVEVSEDFRQKISAANIRAKTASARAAII